MRKLLGTLLILLSLQVHSQSVTVQKPVICDKTELVIEALLKIWNEKPTWTARVPEENAMYTLFVNPTTSAWTLVQLNSTVACILGAGEKSTIIPDYKS